MKAINTFLVKMQSDMTKNIDVIFNTEVFHEGQAINW